MNLCRKICSFFKKGVEKEEVTETPLEEEKPKPVKSPSESPKKLGPNEIDEEEVILEGINDGGVVE